MDRRYVVLFPDVFTMFVCNARCMKDCDAIYCLFQMNKANSFHTRKVFLYVYLPILTSVVGVWLPSPSSSNIKKVDPLLPV